MEAPNYLFMGAQYNRKLLNRDASMATAPFRFANYAKKINCPTPSAPPRARRFRDAASASVVAANLA